MNSPTVCWVSDRGTLGFLTRTSFQPNCRTPCFGTVYSFLTVKLDLKRSFLGSLYNAGGALDQSRAYRFFMIKLELKRRYLIVCNASTFLPLYIFFAILLSGRNTDIWYPDRIVCVFLWLLRVYPFLTVKLDLKQSILGSQYDASRALDPLDCVKSILFLHSQARLSTQLLDSLWRQYVFSLIHILCNVIIKLSH